MNTQQFLKGLAMALVAVVVTAFATTPINWILLIVTGFCAILTYGGKNLIPWLHSDSPVGSLSLLNIVSGLLIALGTGLLDAVALYLVDGLIVWSVVWKLVISVTATYIGSTLFAPPYNITKVKFIHKMAA